MSSRPFFLLPLCFVSALALNVYAALDPTGVYQDYLEKLDAATPPVAAMATAAADGVYPWSKPKAPEPPPVPDPAPLPDPEPEPKPEEPDSPFTTVDASYFDDALFIGDSHTCGYGTEGKSVEEPFTPETENCDLAWGCVIARYFDAEYTLIAHSGQGIVRNWGDEKEVSDCTMRERMLRTFDMDPASRWDFRGCTPDIVVIKLGSNDFSTGVTPSEQAFNASYAQALDQLRAAYGEVPVLCVAPSDNTVILRYLENFLRERQDAHLHLTAMLPGITDWDRDMGANYHPNHRGHRKMAMAVIPYIATITGWEMPDRNVE